MQIGRILPASDFFTKEIWSGIFFGARRKVRKAPMSRYKLLLASRHCERSEANRQHGIGCTVHYPHVVPDGTKEKGWRIGFLLTCCSYGTQPYRVPCAKRAWGMKNESNNSQHNNNNAIINIKTTNTMNKQQHYVSPMQHAIG
jgi:hypothetical protein